MEQLPFFFKISDLKTLKNLPDIDDIGSVVHDIEEPDDLDLQQISIDFIQV